MPIFLIIGGAYGDCETVQTIGLTVDQWNSWKCGDITVFRINSDMRIERPIGVEQWETVKIVNP